MPAGFVFHWPMDKAGELRHGGAGPWSKHAKLPDRRVANFARQVFICRELCQRFNGWGIQAREQPDGFLIPTVRTIKIAKTRMHGLDGRPRSRTKGAQRVYRGIANIVDIVPLEQ